MFHADQVIFVLPCNQGQPSRIWKVQCDWLRLGKECCSAFVAWDEIRAPLKTPAWEATLHQDLTIVTADEERFSSKTAVLP